MLEWWEVVGARLRAWRGLVVLVRLQVVALWLVVPVVAVAVLVMPSLQASLGVWVGCVWVVLAWFWLARTRTVPWRLVSAVLAVSVPWAGVVAWVSARLVAAGGAEVGSVAAQVVAASVVEELGKLVPLAVLAVAAPGRVRRLVVGDWLVLGVACGAGFELVEEGARRLAYLEGGGLGGLLERALCSLGGGPDVLECMGLVTYGLSPFSGEAGGVLRFGGHAVVTGLVAAAVGLGRHLWWRSRSLRSVPGRVAGLRVAGTVVPLLAWWVAVVDHMGRNASDGAQAWAETGGQAPWLVVGATSALTGGGHGRGWVLLVVLVVGAVLDARVLWAGGYTATVLDDVGVCDGAPPGGRVGVWRWRGLARLPRTWWGRLAADAVDAVALPLLEARLAWRAATVARRLGRVRVPAQTVVGLRQARELAARGVCDQDRGRWAVACLALVAVAAGALALALVPAVVAALQAGLEGQDPWSWLAGVLDALGTVWESMSPLERTLAVLALGAVTVASGGSLATAFTAASSLALLDSARAAASLVRDPRRTVASYLATHTPAEIATDAALWLLTETASGLAGHAGGAAARHAGRALAESRLWQKASLVEDFLHGVGLRPSPAHAGGPDPRSALRPPPTPHRPQPAHRTSRPQHNRNRSGSGNSTGGGPPRSVPAPDWNDPATRQKWFDGLETQRTPPYNDAYDYQHRVLGTDIERKLVADDPEVTIFADAVTPDGTAYTAWDAKYTKGGPGSMYEGKAPSFVQERVVKKLDDEIRRYGAVIQSQGNPVDRLVVVTNTPEARAFLKQRIQGLLGDNGPFEVWYVP